MKIAATDPLYGIDQGSTTGAIGSGAAADAIADHEQDTSGAHTAAGVSIVNGAQGVSQWPMLGLSSGTAVAGPYFGGATNVQQALEYLANAINALTGGSPGVARHWPMLALSQGGGGALPVTPWLANINGGGEIVRAHGNLGSTETIDLGDGSYHWGTLNANCTFSFSVLNDTKHRWFTLELIEDGTGGWTVTWPGTVTWLGGTAPIHTTTAGTTTIYAFFTRNGGTTWIGGQLGAAAVSDLDDLTDVTITSAAENDTLVYTGSVWEDRPSGRHVHIVNEPMTGDGTTTVFYLANEAESDTIAAYVNGVRTDVTQDTSLLDKVTFGAAPAAAASLRFDYVGALA